MTGDLGAAFRTYEQVKAKRSDAAENVLESAAERNALHIITLVRTRNLQEARGRGLPRALLARVWRS